MPVVGHDAVGQQAAAEALLGRGQDALEGLVVARLVEEAQAAVGPVEGVINEARFGGTAGAAHAARLAETAGGVNIGS